MSDKPIWPTRREQWEADAVPPPDPKVTIHEDCYLGSATVGGRVMDFYADPTGRFGGVVTGVREFVFHDLAMIPPPALDEAWLILRCEVRRRISKAMRDGPVELTPTKEGA